MKLRPLGDRVIVRRNDEEETTEGGIVIPGSAAEKPSQGEVLAVGPGKTLDNGEIQAPSVKKRRCSCLWAVCWKQYSQSRWR